MPFPYIKQTILGKVSYIKIEHAKSIAPNLLNIWITECRRLQDKPVKRLSLLFQDEFHPPIPIMKQSLYHLDMMYWHARLTSYSSCLLFLLPLVMHAEPSLSR